MSRHIKTAEACPNEEKIIKGEKSSDLGNSIDFLFKWNHTQISNVKFVKKYFKLMHIKTNISNLLME